MYGILAIAACCAIVSLAVAAAALMNSLGKRKIAPSLDRPMGSREAALPVGEERSDSQ